MCVYKPCVLLPLQENVTTTNSSLIPDLTQTQKKVLVNLMDRAIHVINKSDSKNEDLPCKPRFSSESDRSLLSLGSPPQSSSSPINDADSIAAYPFSKFFILNYLQLSKFII